MRRQKINYQNYPRRILVEADKIKNGPNTEVCMTRAKIAHIVFEGLDNKYIEYRLYIPRKKHAKK